MKSAVIGLGPMGQRHIQALKELNLDICGICDKDENKIKEAIKKFSINEEKSYTDASILLKEKKPQFVVIATNSDSHEELTKISAGCAEFILCEKPMANSVKACENIIEICKKRNIKLAINHPQRYSQRFNYLKNIVNEKHFGGVENITFVCGNVGFAMIGSHLLEMARIISGEEIVSVNAVFEESKCRNPRGDRFKDPVGILFGKTANGKKISLIIGNESGHGLKIIISCRYGIIDGDLINGFFVLNYRKEEFRELPPTRYGCESLTETITLPSESVVDLAKMAINGLLKGDEKVKSSAEDSLYIIKILAAGYESSENLGKEIDITSFKSERIFPWP